MAKEGHIWKWDLEEMRNAVEKDPKQTAEPESYPTVSMFTPINTPGSEFGKLTEEHLVDVNRKQNPKNKPRTQNKRKTQPSATKRAGKVRKTAKAAVPPVARPSSTLDKSQTLETYGEIFHEKNCNIEDASSPEKPETLPSASCGNRVSIKEFPVDDSLETRRSNTNQPGAGLATNYQDAYRSRDNVDSESVGCERQSDRLWASSMLSEAAGDSYQVVDPVIPSLTCTDEASELHGTPPSAHIENSSFAGERLSILKVQGTQVSNKTPHFNSDEIFSDAEESDDFPVGSSRMEDIMPSITAEAAIGDPSKDWWPQDFEEDVLVFDNNDDHAQHLPSSGNFDAVNDIDGPSLALNNHPTPPAEPHQDHRFAHDNADKAARDSKDGLDRDRSRGVEDCFNDDDLDKDLLNLANSDSTIQLETPQTSLEKPSAPRLQWMEPKTYIPKKPSQIQITPLYVSHPKSSDYFPKAVRDRSPILGLTNHTVLRTCIRIGEALNAAAIASRNNTDAIIELYARVIFSEREPNGGFKQFFQFGDLFTDKPPYLSGTHSLWKGVPLWNVDSEVFLGEKGKGKLARVVGRIKRPEKGGACELIVLSIWEVDWAAVELARSIVCPSPSIWDAR